jgi:hypothetical protein
MPAGVGVHAWHASDCHQGSSLRTGCALEEGCRWFTVEPQLEVCSGWCTVSPLARTSRLGLVTPTVGWTKAVLGTRQTPGREYKPLRKVTHLIGCVVLHS